jgi:sortase (surface protein transpeptidase)
MHHRKLRTRSRRLVLLDAVAIVLAVVGLIALVAAHIGRADPPIAQVSGRVQEHASRPPTATHVEGTSTPRPSANPGPVAMARSRPVELSIPTIDVQTSLALLGLQPDGTLQVPGDYSVAGWYHLGPSPGEPGAAVIVGHVDSTAGPAVFYRLGELTPGTSVHVARADGSEATFKVYAVREFAKSAFPTSLVYGPTQDPELRLITCGGPFDSATGHYLDNVVVFARAARG